jgi:hypothetical protein
MVSCCSKAHKGAKRGRDHPGVGSPRPILRLVKIAAPRLTPLKQPFGGHRRRSGTPHRAMAQSVHFATVHGVGNDSLIVFPEMSGYITGTLLVQTKTSGKQVPTEGHQCASASRRRAWARTP